MGTASLTGQAANTKDQLKTRGNAGRASCVELAIRRKETEAPVKSSFICALGQLGKASSPVIELAPAGRASLG